MHSIDYHSKNNSVISCKILLLKIFMFTYYFFQINDGPRETIIHSSILTWNFKAQNSINGNHIIGPFPHCQRATNCSADMHIILISTAQQYLLPHIRTQKYVKQSYQSTKNRPSKKSDPK